MPSHARRAAAQVVLYLRLELEDVHPAIWRRLLVPGSVRLDQLSDLLQAAMDWNRSHALGFQIGASYYTMLDEGSNDDELDEKEFTLVQALGQESRFRYECDFGDGWEHRVDVEQLADPSLGLKFAVCVDGQRAGPPDVAGR